MINVGRNQPDKFRQVMPNNTIYLAILRDPVKQFESVFEYIDVSRVLELLRNSSDPFHDFLMSPLSHVIHQERTRGFSPEMNMIKNGKIMFILFFHLQFQFCFSVIFIVLIRDRSFR